MFRICKEININKCFKKCSELGIIGIARNKNECCRSLYVKHASRTSDQKIEPFGWFLLLVPITTFGLGTWQVQRKKWKEQLIADLEKRVHSKIVELPEDLSELKSLEYCKVQVTGHFDHSKEIHIGPRSLLKDGDAASDSGLLSRSGTGSSGFLVVTPFQLSDRDMTILINRGWVPKNKKNPETRKQGQITEEVTLTGVVRLHEDRPPFLPQNKPQSDSWFYRDLHAMSRITGAEPIFLDATVDSSVEGGPVGGQTRVTIRNEHLSYIITWYSLSALTGAMWYRQFIKKLALL